MKKIILLLIAVVSIFTLTSCSMFNNEEETDPRFENVIFEGITVEYDGRVHSIEVENLPEGFTVSYSGNNVSEVGKHVVIANIFENQVLVLTLKATIKITGEGYEELPEELTGVTFKSIEVPYTGMTYSIEIENLPEGYKVAYAGNNVSEIGKHVVTATVRNSNDEVVHVFTRSITIVEKTTVELPLV